MSVLRGEPVFAAPCVDAIVECNGLDIARVTVQADGSHTVLSIACVHPRHNRTIDLPGLNGRTRTLMADIRDRSPCPLCNGARWVDPQSDTTRQVVLFGAALGMFRGIQIPREELMDRTNVCGAALRSIVDEHKAT